RCLQRRGRHRLAKRAGKPDRTPARSCEPGQITPIPALGAPSARISDACTAEFCKWLICHTMPKFWSGAANKIKLATQVGWRAHAAKATMARLGLNVVMTQGRQAWETKQ